MKWQQIQSQWLDYRGQVKQRWGKLTDHGLTIIDGKRVLAGKIVEHGATTEAVVEKEIIEFETKCIVNDSAAGCS